VPDDHFEVHGHLLGAAAAWEQGRCYDAVLHLRCAADCACDHGAEQRSIDLYRAAAELSSTLPQSPPDSQIRQRRREPHSALPSVWLRALGELPLAVRLRIAIDVLSQLLEGGVRAVLPRTPSSRLHFDNVRVDVEGRAHILDAGSHSGVGLLLWEILAGRFADTDSPPPLPEVVDDVTDELETLVAQTLDNDPSCARVDQVLCALELFAGAFLASHDDVRAACGIARDDEPTHPGPPLSEWDFGDEDLGASGVRHNGSRPAVPGLAGRHAVPQAVMARLDAIHGGRSANNFRVADGETAETAVQDMAPILQAAGFATPVPPAPSADETSAQRMATTPAPVAAGRARVGVLLGAAVTVVALLTVPLLLSSRSASTEIARARPMRPVMRSRAAIRQVLVDPPRTERGRRPK
jgi:hypothetical protein